jgi:ligand-binding sensor domain-containing protein
VTGLATTNDGTVWIGNTSVNINDPFLFSIDKTGVWRSYIPSQTVGRYPLDIVIDAASRKWIRLSTSGGTRGLMLFDEKTNTQIYFSEQSGSGTLPDKSVNAIDIDKNGQVWLGTDKGIAVFTNPTQIRAGSAIPDALLPIVEGFPLFFDKKINCIKTDGGNRKWVGTPDGAFLLSEDGLQTILQFNTSNSPLTNDNIITIAIDEKSGEVFFGTDRGIISYRGDATTGTEAHEEVKVFPNPVLSNFEGFVGISGLANNARVKITDTGGKLAYETRANGGTATWNVKSYNGRRAAAGVYLIFSATEDGAENFVGKIAVLE